MQSTFSATFSLTSKNPDFQFGDWMSRTGAGSGCFNSDNSPDFKSPFTVRTDCMPGSRNSTLELSCFCTEVGTATGRVPVSGIWVFSFWRPWNQMIIGIPLICLHFSRRFCNCWRFFWLGRWILRGCESSSCTVRNGCCLSSGFTP